MTRDVRGTELELSDQRSGTDLGSEAGDGGIRPVGGRPMSEELSGHLLDAAADILAEEGWDRFTADNLSRRAKAGKAGIYRRWPNMRALALDVLDRSVLVGVAADTGTLEGDLEALLDTWRSELSQAEKAAASLIGVARHDPEVRARLETVLVRPLAAAVREIADREASRRQRRPAGRNDLAVSVLQALWWQRYTVAGPALSVEEVQRLIDDVVVPTLDCG